MKFIKNGRIILKDRILTGKALAYDGKIRGFVNNDEIPEDADSVIDAGGAYVSPGLIDIHIHGYLGHDVCDCDPEGIRIIAGGIVKNGVTGFLPTTMTVAMDTIEKAIDVCRNLKEESKLWNGTTILGCHAEGPFINVKKKGAQEERFIKKPDADFVIRNKDMVRVITMAPETDDNFAAIKKIVENTDTVISMGHTDADYETAAAAVANGVRSTTHLFNAMSALGHRNPGVVGAALKFDVCTELIVDTFHVDKALYDMIAKQKGEKLIFITDCLPAGGLPDGEYTLGGQKFISKGIQCRLENGTIAGSVLKLNKGVMNFYKNSALPLYEAVNCASLHPAKLIGYGKTKGSIDIGKDADLFIADDEFNVQKTIIGGTVRYEVEG